MEDNTLLTEAFENLSNFEFYKFRKTFGEVFLIIAILTAIGSILETYYKFATNSIIEIFTFIYFLFLLTIYLLLLFLIKSLKKTRIINGVLVKSKTTFGIITMLFGLFFSLQFIPGLLSVTILIIFPILNSHGLIELIATYMRIISLITLYYIETKIFFPNEHNKSMFRFLFITILFALSNSIILILLNIPNSPLYWIYSNFPSEILLLIYGIYEMIRFPIKRRDLYE